MQAVAVLSVLLAGQSLSATRVSLSESDIEKARTYISEMRENRRGPYAGVMWFCADGQTLPPKRYACRDFGGGKQYGVLSSRAKWLAGRGVYVGTVLTELAPDALTQNDYDRARSLIIEYYLERALNGWALFTAKNYRGFRQVEDEQESARQLLIELMKRSRVFNDRRSLAIRATRALPYGRTGALADEIRALAGVLGDGDNDFADLRFKIHAMPEPTDIDGVKLYAAKKDGDFKKQADELIAKMTAYYDPQSRVARLEDVRRWIWHSGAKKEIETFAKVDANDTFKLIHEGTKLMGYVAELMKQGASQKQGERNLLLLHVMGLVEELWVALTAPVTRMPINREEGLALVATLADASHHLGLLSTREIAAIRLDLATATTSERRYIETVSGLSRILIWARARVIADLGLALPRYQSVEPQSAHVVDDILRSGVMLPLAALLDRLGRDAEALQQGGHRLAGLGSASSARLRGENPGLAIGKLKVVRGHGQSALKALRRDSVALLYDLPPDLPPVAGLLTVGSAGSLSHVALLARNLGIPHASIDSELAASLNPFHDQDVLLGVSQHRRVALGPKSAFKEAASMQHSAYKTAATGTSFTIDAARLDLAASDIKTLTDISHEDSGVRLGPKAAELGRLKKLFPERVSDAAVIPFGAFVKHVNRPGKDGAASPLAQLQAAYKTPLRGEERDAFLLEQLKSFREQVAELPFTDGFVNEVRAGLRKLGRDRSFGVFVRSDTNVEDLKNFTGAGLNKTVANVVGYRDVLAAIRAVWASPFSERSFRWRQRLLKNPEHVYPSVILHRTVASEISGVLVTTDLENRSADALTVSASEGVAAVVDGGSPETVVIERSGDIRLLASSRSATRKVIPRPPRQGVTVLPAKGMDPLLSEAHHKELRGLADEVQSKIPNPDGLPWDIEFGILKDKAWLLQIRPLRTSKAASKNPFLQSLESNLRLSDAPVDLSHNLPHP